MRGSSRRVGPLYDTLKVVVQPMQMRTRYTVTRMHFDGPRRDDTIIASGVLGLTAQDLQHLTALGLLERVADHLRNPPQEVGAPSGAMGGQLTLDLDFRP